MKGAHGFNEVKFWTDDKFRILFVFLSTLLFVPVLLFPIKAEDWPPLDAKMNQSVETLKRLKHMDIRSNAALHKVLLQTLDQVKGRPEFVQLVIAFDLKDQDESLLNFVTQYPESSAGLAALDFVVKSTESDQLANVLNGDKLAPLLTLLGELPHSKATDLLLQYCGNKQHAFENRKTALRALCRTKAGVEALLNVETKQGIHQELRLSAAYALNQIPWPEIKSRALELIPLPMVKGETSLPSIKELVLQHGDISKGKAVFLRPESGCSMCHRIGDHGVDFGPGLSEIGDKLGKDALFQSILDPNGGISFGFEGWEVILKSGEEWIGIVIGETEQSITLKNQSGLLLTLEKSGIESRSQMKNSLMPEGLQQAMTAQELVDLVSYLSSLKKRS